MRTRTTILACVLIVVSAGRLSAQSAETNAQVNLDRFQRAIDDILRSQEYKPDLNIPANQRMILEYGGSVSLNFLAMDDTDQETHIFRQSVLSGYLHVNVDGVHDVLVRLRASETDFNSGDQFDESLGPQDTVEPTLDRGIYTFNLANYMSAYEGKLIESNVVIAAGRQLAHWANGLTLSQEIDGGLIALSRGKTALDIVVGISRDSSNDFDSSRPSFDNDMRREFYGGMLSYQVTPQHRPFVYGLVQRDRNKDEVLFVDNPDPTLDIFTRFRYESFYIGAGSAGSFSDRLLYSLEAVYEGGEGLSNSYDRTKSTAPGIPQTEEEINAWAVDFRLDYILADANNTRLSAELLIGSGDRDRGTASNTYNGNEPGTDDNAFNAFGYIDTGLAFGPRPGNLIMIRGGAQTVPFPTSSLFGKMQVGVNLFLLNKLDSKGSIDENTDDHHYLGFEADGFVTWQITSDVSWQMRYGAFFPGQAITTDNDPRHFFFTGVTYAF